MTDTLAPESAEIFREGIALGRKFGVHLCAHLTNSGIIRLQAKRLAREATVADKNMFDVVSMEEAWLLTAERRAELA